MSYIKQVKAKNALSFRISAHWATMKVVFFLKKVKIDGKLLGNRKEQALSFRKKMLQAYKTFA